MSERFQPRGIGANWLPCFICGGPKGGGLQADMASFVDGYAGGLRVQAMFVEQGLHAYLDFHPSEPNWVQLKLGACPEHVANLEWIGKTASTAGGVITPEMIRECLSLLPAPGDESP